MRRSLLNYTVMLRRAWVTSDDAPALVQRLVKMEYVASPHSRECDGLITDRMTHVGHG
jgi:hypothetical protein